MDDPFAIPIYVAIASYVVCIIGGSVSSQRKTVFAFCVIGSLVTSMCVAAFTYGVYSLHVGMSGNPEDFSFTVPTVVGVLMLAPFVIVAFARLRNIDQ